jgi:7-keto-8-aminopelargonate synthetase-like enzyme
MRVARTIDVELPPLMHALVDLPWSSFIHSLAPHTHTYHARPHAHARTRTRTHLHELHRFKAERIITSPQSSSIMVQGRARPVLNFCSNNYLGLADHPAVITAAKTALDTHGNGLGSVRFICGTQDIHKKLERNISDFHSMDDAILCVGLSPFRLFLM